MVALPATWFVGCGNMAGAMVAGWRRAGVDLSRALAIRPSGRPVAGVETVAAIHEALSLINEQLWLGHFEMWTSSSMVLFRHAALLETQGDDATLTLDQAETLIETAIDECERFYPVFQFVLWSDKTPQEAIAAAMIETQGEA